MQKLWKDFIKCGILGWCLEITFTALHSLQQRKFTLQGTTSLWMFPIYGAGCLLRPICALVKNATGSSEAASMPFSFSWQNTSQAVFS